jgi:hypothetical protein
MAEPPQDAPRQHPPVWPAELPLTLPTGPVPDGPAATELPDPLMPPELPPVWRAELPLTPVEPAIPDAPIEVPDLLAAPDIDPVVPGCSTQFGLTTPEAPVLAPPWARAIEPEPRAKTAAMLNILIDLFM